MALGQIWKFIVSLAYIEVSQYNSSIKSSRPKFSYIIRNPDGYPYPVLFFNPETRPLLVLKSRVPAFKYENSRIPKNLLNTICIRAWFQGTGSPGLPRWLSLASSINCIPE